jgi:hypothetical protein
MRFVCVFSDGCTLEIPAVNNRTAIVIAYSYARKHHKIVKTVTPKESCDGHN